VVLDWRCGALAEGLACYHRGEFFAAHEHWEAVWLLAAEPEKSFLQALIQMSSACHHRQRGNLKGAASLMRKSLGRLELCSADFGGIGVSAVRLAAGEWLRALERGTPLTTVSCPQIVILE
jgi:predicted metal-dependent hydrolase